MLKQNRFISVISILGTALAIMMIMTIIVTGEIRNMSMAPENNRDRTLYVRYEIQQDTIKNMFNSSNVTREIVDEYLLKLDTPEAVAAYDIPFFFSDAEFITVNREGYPESIHPTLRRVNDGYWNVFSYTFLEGAPFSREEFESGVNTAVISESTARKLFAREESPVGKTILIDFNPFRISGVVKDVSAVFKKAQGDIWVPYTAYPTYMFEVALLARNTGDFPQVIEEVKNCEKRFATANAPLLLTLPGPSNNRTNSMSDDWYYSDEEMMEMVKIQNRKITFILLVLVLIPAINLSSFSLSRMKKRMAEIGIRKAFGARKYTILFQVLYENMITSLAGGILGLLLSYLTVYGLRHWLLDISADHSIPVGMLVSLPVFLAVFAICILMNLLSAGLPAYRASRATIVSSLTQNDR